MAMIATFVTYVITCIAVEGLLINELNNVLHMDSEDLNDFFANSTSNVDNFKDYNLALLISHSIYLFSIVAACILMIMEPCMPEDKDLQTRESSKSLGVSGIPSLAIIVIGIIMLVRHGDVLKDINETYYITLIMSIALIPVGIVVTLMALCCFCCMFAEATGSATSDPYNV